MMGKVIVGITMSLDGYINDGNGSVGDLYYDLAELPDTPILADSIRDTGAVVMGRKAFAMGDADAYADTYEYQVPIFVLTHKPPQKHPHQNDKLTFTFVTDGVESAIAQAKTAAGHKDVTVVGGANTFQQCLLSGLADEIHIDIMPILLGVGQKAFEQINKEKIRLEKIEVIETSIRTSLRFRVVK